MSSEKISLIACLFMKMCYIYNMSTYRYMGSATLKLVDEKGHAIPGRDGVHFGGREGPSVLVIPVDTFPRQWQLGRSWRELDLHAPWLPEDAPPEMVHRYVRALASIPVDLPLCMSVLVKSPGRKLNWQAPDPAILTV